jgi:hypothetical protein
MVDRSDARFHQARAHVRPDPWAHDAAALELWRLRTVRPGLAIFRMPMFLAVVIALIAAARLYW